MNHIVAIAKKELRAYFLSPIAIIFLGTFLALTLFTFFVGESFFSRNIADVRPLFSWLPVLLIFLAGALTMRLWSEEQKLGTMELLLTLPVDIHRVVLGKFFAALALVGVALLLTLCVPITVGMMGDLDVGPVVGGYIGAFLLAGAYLAIGLCISSLTENQIVALILTFVVCGLFYLVGADFVVALMDNRTAEILSGIGTGSRFESIRRGVLDVRDLVYYFSIIVTFLALNTVVLKAKGWSAGVATAPKRRSAGLLALLIAANAFVLNLVLANVSGVRIDLTERGEYSISNVTKDLIRGLDEPLLIRGYFSEKTHPLLAPMVPRIRDMLAEYQLVAPGKVVMEYVDPRVDEKLEEEANQLYGIRSFPFKIADRLDQAVVNSYFSVLVKYGDQFQVLNFSDLIEVQVTGVDNIEVKLRNLEYDLTRTIKKVAYGFQTLDAVFADLSEPAQLIMYVTPTTLPQNFQGMTATVETVAKKLEKRASGKFVWSVQDPTAADAKENPQSLFAKYQMRPFPTALFSQDTFYFHLLLKVGDRFERVSPPESMSEADLEKDLTASLKRLTPGFLKTVGLAKPKTDEPELPPQLRQQRPPPPPDVTQVITRQLGETFAVEDVDLTTGNVSGSVDVLFVFGPTDYNDEQRFAIDQHLMRGGTVIVVGGKFELDPHGGQSVKVKKVRTGLEEMLASYGVVIQDSLVMDEQNEPIPMPTERQVGGYRVREMQYLKYPFFVDVRPEGMSDSSPVVAGLPAVTLPWASPITVNLPEKKEGEDALEREATTLLSSSDKAWTTALVEVQPDFTKFPTVGFPPTPSDTKKYDLAVAVRGTFESFFKGKKAPGGEGESGPQVIERSPPTARLLVVGTNAVGHDMVLNLTRQAQSNLQFLQNMVDWGLEDTDLLSIRSRGTFARTLRPMDTDERGRYEAVNYGVVAIGLALIVLLTAGRRRRLRPIPLDPPPTRAKAASSEVKR